MFNAIKMWKKWKAFLPRSIYCSTAQSQPHNQNCYSHHSKCSCSSKIFYGYNSFLTCRSNCLDHYATYTAKLGHRRSTKIMSSATNFQK